MSLWIIISMGISLVSTLLLEEVFALLLGLRRKEDLLLILFVNILTNPPIVLCYNLISYYTTWNTIPVAIGLELLVVLVEYHYFKCYGKNIKAPFAFAVVINLFSYGAGKLFQIL